MFARLFRIATLSAVALASPFGCYVHISAPSTNPLPDTFYYPAGVLMDPDGRLLYVSNGNADLRYGGGTLMAIDLPRFHCAVEAYRKQTDATVKLDPGCSIYPTASDIGVVRDSNNMPTAGCIADPTDPQIADCIESPFILSNATVRVGNFAGTMRIRRVGDATSTQRTLFLAVRGDPSVTFADIDLSELAAVPDSTGHIDQPGFINCYDDRTSLLDSSNYDTVTGYGGASQRQHIPVRCDSSHLIQTYTCNDRLGCKKGDNDIPSEPFNMLLEEGTHANGNPFSHLLVSHLSAGQVTLIDLLGTPYVEDVSQPFFTANGANQRGAFGLTRVGLGDNPLYYVSSDLIPSMATFRITVSPTGETISPEVTIPLSGEFQNGANGLALVEAPDQQKGYFTQGAPPQIAVIDTSLGQPDTHGLPYNKIVEVIDICTEPSNLALRQAPTGTGSVLAVSSHLWVSCFTSDQLMLVDADLGIVDETVLTGRGPSEFAFNFSGSETPTADQLPTPLHQYLYVALYNESTIGVVDVDPASPTYNRLVARIGLPQPPPTYLTQH